MIECMFNILKIDEQKNSIIIKNVCLYVFYKNCNTDFKILNPIEHLRLNSCTINYTIKMNTIQINLGGPIYNIITFFNNGLL